MDDQTPQSDRPESARLEASFKQDTDIIQPFQLEATNLRGRLVRLDEVLDDILGRHDYPLVISDLLAEALTVTVVLSSALKYQGIFTLQTRGDGAVPMLVTDVTSDGKLRGYAKFDEEKLAELLKDVELDGERPSHAIGLNKLLGKGYLAFTVDQGDHTERYQGITELTGDSIADCTVNYFKQSEQLDTGVSVKVQHHHGHWRAGGLMLQRMPDDQEAIVQRRLGNDEEDGWRRAMVMLGSLTTDEMVDAGLPANDLLYRLFNEDGVRVFERSAVERECRCNEVKIRRMLKGLPPDALKDMALPVEGEDGADNPDTVDGKALEVTCEFCSTLYAVPLGDILRDDMTIKDFKDDDG
ncbi:MAG: Hsp33 family molecular chaperone HslO [Alphaproteobacteria bacterium]|nr:Hsp33 family molecular chaperone HslO [Alphaproteobacteria bacterium SS10]